MKILQKNKWQEIISGANLLGTGGGGTITAALSVLKKINRPIKLVSLNELDNGSFICTVFGVGGKQNCDPVKASQQALSLFQKMLKRKVSAIIPVEVGPMAVANAMFLSSQLRIPLLDSDIVGLRSSPEIFLETISMPNLKRTPCVAANDKGKSIVVKNVKNIQQLEKKLRNFAVACGGDAFVAGYPLKIGQILGVVPADSIIIAQQTGKLIKLLKKKRISLNKFCRSSGWKILGGGKIIKESKNNSKGFIKGIYQIKSDRETLKVIFKNENLIFLKNDKVILTCPDSISLLDLELFEGVNNFEENKGKRVLVLGRKAIPIWRTRRGRKLFSPKNLGFPYPQKLLR